MRDRGATDPRLLFLMLDLAAGAAVPALLCRFCGSGEPGPGDRCAACGARAVMRALTAPDCKPI